MKKNYPALLRLKVLGKIRELRRYYFMLFGLQTGENVILGKIICDSPNKLIIGNNCEIENNITFKITKPFNDNNYIKIGNGVFIGNGCEFTCNTFIIIGDNCLIASRCSFVDTGHEIVLNININKQALNVAPIILEEDVWIGTQCVVLKGVRIGKGCIIGAGSLVNKSIPPNQIWAGIPARFIRNRE